MAVCILVVDDNADIVRLIERILIKQGHEVLAFESPLAALAAMKKGNIDLAILDIDMPEMDGLTLAAEMKKANIPFIFLSAFIDSDCVTKVEMSGAIELLLKPVRQAQLILSVTKALEKSKNRRD